DGVIVETANKDFFYKFGASLQYDGAWYTADRDLQFGRDPTAFIGRGGVGPFNDGFNMRRARLRLEGTMYEVIDFLMEYEFANGFTARGVISNGAQQADQIFLSPGPTDMWLQIKHLPVIGNIRIGSQKEPWSLEHIANYRYLEFMERSYL